MGTLLHYARAIDNTMLVALGTLAAAISKGTKETTKEMWHLLDCTATHPDTILRCRASNVTLHIDSDASYLSKSEAHSRAGGFHFLGD